MTNWGRTLSLAIATLALAACAKTPLATVSQPERDAIETALMRDISVLASDEYGGRLPGTPGEALTTSYIAERLDEAGLVSGTNDPGSAWFAPVDLISSRALSSSLILRTNAGEIAVPETGAAAFAGSRRALIDGVEVVYVGKQGEIVAAENEMHVLRYVS